MTYAVNQALKVSESKFLSWKLSRSARFASVLAADALASWSEDSVPHFAAAKPDQAARTATTASRIASMTVITRSRPWRSAAAPSFSAPSAARARCSAISFPTSLGDKPSGTAALPQRRDPSGRARAGSRNPFARRPPGPVRSQSTAGARSRPHPEWVSSLADGGQHACVGDGLAQPLVIPLILVGVSDREVGDGLVDVLAAAHVARDHGGPPGPGVRPGQRPPAEPAVVVELVRVHQGDAHAALHVAQLAHVVVLGRHMQALVPIAADAGAAGADAARPAEEGVGRGLYQQLALDHPLALVGVLALPGERRQHRLLCLLELEEQRLVRAVAEQQQDERLGADRADPHDLAREVAEVVAAKYLAPVRRQRLLVERDGVPQFLEDARVALDGIADDHRMGRPDAVLPVDLVAHLQERLEAGALACLRYVRAAALHRLLGVERVVELGDLVDVEP